MLLSGFIQRGSAQENDIKELIDAVKSAPSLYRTPEAADYFSRLGQSSSVSVQQDRDAAIAGLRAAIKLGDRGQAAKEAVPTLVDLFPRLEHVVTKPSVHYTPGNGSLEDWVQTYLVSEKNNFIFSSPLIEYASLTKCENWIEASPVTTLLSKKTGSGGRILDAVADIFIILRVNAGACALARITGNDLGVKQESWRSWYNQTSGSFVRDVPPTPLAMAGARDARGRQIPFPDIAVGGKYKLHLITNDDLVGTITSRDDSSLVLKNEAGVPYSFRTMLIEKFESLPSAVPESGTVQKTGASNERTEMGALVFDDLLKGNLIGKTVEIRIKNGSIFKGTLTQVAGETARINIEGSEISVTRGVIVGIRLLTK
jgi:hypothetical protein